MTTQVPQVMNSILRLVREQRLGEATAEIQKALSGASLGTTTNLKEISRQSTRPRRPLSAAVGALRAIRTSASKSDNSAVDETDLADRDFLVRSYSCHSGVREYKLYVPPQRDVQKRPLLIMLHGCKQNADDFAAGTQMNALAEEHSMLVAYPNQANTANVSKCWNWFDPRHQQRGVGEPAIIAGLTRDIISTYECDPERIYVCGLSAGGAMAVVMGTTYSDLYGAIGVHSGLAYQSASDVMSAFEAMKGGNRSEPRASSIRTIIFHGDADATVHSSNGDNIAGMSGNSASGIQTKVSRGGRQCVRTLTLDSSGEPLIEHWLIHGAGHAWSGGNSAGSFTDAKGPDASREMVRFFLQGKAGI